jgi:hypothetical protein
MKANRGSGSIALRILDLGIRWRWVVSFAPRPLYSQENRPWYPLDRRLDGLQILSGRGGEEKNSQSVPELEPPIIQPVAQRSATELSRLIINMIALELLWLRYLSLIQFIWCKLVTFCTERCCFERNSNGTRVTSLLSDFVHFWALNRDKWQHLIY